MRQRPKGKFNNAPQAMSQNLNIYLKCFLSSNAIESSPQLRRRFLIATAGFTSG